jgi:predicted extracellular nuclease
VEGWGNNKALEIFNPTDQWLDMADYRLERYSNGATASEANQMIALEGMLSPLDVFVYTLDKQDPDGVDFEAPVWDELAAVTDFWLCPVYEENNAMYYNGNDALVLRHTPSNTVVDVFGTVGQDPGTTGWAGMTQNHTLIRKQVVYEGDTNPIDPFLVVDEWDGIAWVDDSTNSTLDVVFANLGWHAYCLEVVDEGCTDPEACN